MDAASISGNLQELKRLDQEGAECSWRAFYTTHIDCLNYMLNESRYKTLQHWTDVLLWACINEHESIIEHFRYKSK